MFGGDYANGGVFCRIIRRRMGLLLIADMRSELLRKQRYHITLQMESRKRKS